MKTFSEYINEDKIGFELKDLIDILTNEGYSQYKNKKTNKMHEYTNKGIIVSIGGYVEDKGMTIFRIRDYDVSNGTKFNPIDIKNFTEIIRNRSLKDALKYKK